MSDAVAIIIGASISATVTVMVVAIQHRLEQRSDDRRVTSQRLASFSAAGHAIAVGLTSLARAPEADKGELSLELREGLADRFNSSLSQVLLLDADPIVRAAWAIDRELVALTREAEGKVWGAQEWRDRRSQLSDLVDEFQRASRAHLGAPPLSAAAPRLVS